MNNIKISTQANLPTQFGDFKIKSFKEDDKEHLVIYKIINNKIPMVRIHSECLTGDAIGSLKCDCRDQLAFALETINKYGGYVLYLRQEGRGIGLFNKVNAYTLQDNGMDTVEANLHLGLPNDARSYEIAEYMLEHFKVKEIQLLTNNPDKLQAFKNIKVVKRVPISLKTNDHNKDYLNIKKSKMGHKL